jgi:NADPH:quinone reductase
VVVDLEASETNFPDILYIEGRYQKLPPFPFTPGLAGVGRVSELAQGVDSVRVGQKVLVLPECGTFAEKVVAPASYCFPVPDAMSSETAASFGLVYQTAYFALTDRGQFRQGDTVLVLGATGGIGMAAVQLAKALGALHVTAATRGEANAEFLRDIGADSVVDVSGEDMRDALRDGVMAATNGHGADVVIDPVGGEVSAASIRAMAWCGRLVVVGFASGVIPKIGANYLLVKNISASGIQWTDYRARQPDRVHAAQPEMFDLWTQGKLSPRITEVLPLADYALALKALNEGRARGKLILTTGKTT